MNYSIDSDVAIAAKGAVQKQARKADNESVAFWNVHADYWAERGDHTKAAECRAEAERAR